MVPIRAAELLIEKIRRDYRDDVSAVVIMGSTIYNETHSRSDLDLFYIPKTERGRNLGFTFILDGVGYDIWCLGWERLERIANHEERITSIVTEGRVLYFGSDDDRTRWEALRDKALDVGDRPRFLKMAGEKIDEGVRAYFDSLDAPDLPGTRFCAIGVVYAVTHALALLNRTTIKRGRGKLKGEILAMPLVPADFAERYDAVFSSKEAAGVREACLGLIRGADALIRRERASDIPAVSFPEALHGFYEELINYYNKIYHASETGDAVTALFAGAEIVHEIREALAGTGVSDAGLPDLLGRYDPDDLGSYAEAAREHQSGFEGLLKDNGVRPRVFGSETELADHLDKR